MHFKYCVCNAIASIFHQIHSPFCCEDCRSSSNPLLLMSVLQRCIVNLRSLFTFKHVTFCQVIFEIGCWKHTQLTFTAVRCWRHSLVFYPRKGLSQSFTVHCFLFFLLLVVIIVVSYYYIWGSVWFFYYYYYYYYYYSKDAFSWLKVTVQNV